MQQRILFMADYLRKVDSVSALCRLYGISRKTAYKWINRCQEEGSDALAERFSKAHHYPNKTPYLIEQEIIKLRQQFMIAPGPKKLQALLVQQFPNTHIPSKTTIYNILTRAGLIDKKRRQRRRRIPAYPKPFAPVKQSNELWSVDYKGQFKLGNNKWCYPLTVMDHHSRFLLGCDALPGSVLIETKAAFIQLFRLYGLPLRIRSDNGAPFASASCGGLSNLSIWWIKLGILPERIDLGKPQQNGQHERMHRTLKQATCKPPASTMTCQQKRFNHFCNEYNTLRPHESLDQTTPEKNYKKSSRIYSDKLTEIQYPDYYKVVKVSDNGVIHWGTKRVYVSNLLKEERVAMNEISDGVWCIFFGPILLGQFDEREGKSKTKGYFSIKV